MDKLTTLRDAEKEYKKWEIVQAASPIFKNLKPEILDVFAEQELAEHKKKRELIDQQFEGLRFKTIGDTDRNFMILNGTTPWAHLQDGNILFIKNRSAGKGQQFESISSSDLLEISRPVCTKVGDEKGYIVPIEITPIEIAKNKVWKFGVNKENFCFYVMLSKEGNEIEIVGTDKGFLSGDYNQYIDEYKPGNAIGVKIIPRGGIPYSLEANDKLGWADRTYRNKPSQTIDFEELFEAA